ncbi:MAG: hypothetical protein E7072_05885 [Bacteroidales bacterium]|nr:hypothetical protein [Bacteroidales bacterium]
MNTKQFFTIIMLLASVFTIHAEYLVVEETTGNKTYYDLGSKPVVSFKDNQFLVKSDVATLELGLADVGKYYFQAESTDLNLSFSSLFIRASKKGVIIKNGQPGSLVEIYSLTGVNKGTFVIGNDGSLEISLDSYSSGVYVVKTTLKTIKIIK